MNSTAIKEAAAVGYPRDKMIGVWWSGAEPDVTPAGDQSKGYKALMLQHGAGKFKVHADLEKFVLSKGKSVAKDDYAQVLYNRGLLNSMIGTEAIRTAHEEVRQQADDRRADPLGLREPQPHRRAHQGARLRGHGGADQVLLPGPPGRRHRPRPAVGRQGVEGDLRQLQGRPVDPRPDGQGRRRPSTPPRRRSRRATAPRRAERADAMRCRVERSGVCRLPAKRWRGSTAKRWDLRSSHARTSARPHSCSEASVVAAKTQRLDPFLSVNNIEVVYYSVILVLKGVSLDRAQGRHRRAARRQRRRQDHDAQGDLQPAARRARRGHQGRHRVRRRRGARAVAQRSGARAAASR